MYILCMYAVTVGDRFLFMTGSRTLAFGYMGYGGPTLATAGLLVFQCIIAEVALHVLFVHLFVRLSLMDY